MTPVVSVQDFPQVSSACVASDSSPNRPEGPGLVVFGSSMRVDYSNRRARSLMTQRQACRNGATATDALPLKVIELGFQIQERVGQAMHVGNWSRVRISRRIHTPEGPMRLQAFGLPDTKGLQPFLIAVVIEPLRSRRTPEISATETDGHDNV